MREKKIVAFNQGQAGDLCINTVAARLFKKKYPDKILLMNIAKKYQELSRLFDPHPYIDNLFGWEGYDEVIEADVEMQKRYEESGEYEFWPRMPKQNPRFPYEIHQAHAVCTMNGFSDEDVELLEGNFQCELNEEVFGNIFPAYEYLAFAPFAGWYNQTNKKKLSIERAQEIADLICSRGHKILQIGGRDEPELQGLNVFKVTADYFTSMKNILSCRGLVTTDTWCAWYASSYGYGFPTVGLYSTEDYPNDTIKNIQPINPNGQYLSANRANDIPLEEIAEAIKNI